MHDAVHSYRQSRRLSVSVSVCLCVSRGSSRLHCAKMAEQTKMVFGVNTPGGPCSIVLKEIPDPPQRGGSPVLNFVPPVF